MLENLPDEAWIETGTGDDFETVPRPVAMLCTKVSAGSSTDWHSHGRVQLLYATRGLLTVDLADKAWIVPERHALLIARDQPHRTSCLGALDLCTAFIDAACLDSRRAGVCRIVQVSALLDASLQALAHEPFLYDRAGRGGCLARLVVDEIQAAPDAVFALPMPSDPRLQKLCRALIEMPALNLDLDAWADTVGLSTRTLTRRFRAETSLSLAEWRRRLRATRALSHRAEGTPENLAAEAVGYKSATALRTMIRRMSP